MVLWVSAGDAVQYTYRRVKAGDTHWTSPKVEPKTCNMNDMVIGMDMLEVAVQRHLID